MVYLCTKTFTSKTQHADIISKRQDNVRQGGQKAHLHPTLPDRGRHLSCGNGKDGRRGFGSAAGLQQEDSGRELATIPQLHGSREDASHSSYNGQAFKHLRADTLSDEALEFAQKHLWITCFLYGLLRPMDGIVPYRMEHCVTIEATNDKPIHQFWKERLTDVLIDSVKADDGILLHLSTEEYEHLFDWKRVCKEVTVVQPLFYVRQKDGRLKMQAVWAKSCRGAMVRFILNNRLVTPEELSAFNYEGFEYAPLLGDANNPHFVREFIK